MTPAPASVVWNSVLLEPTDRVAAARPLTFSACLNARGTYTTEHFVLRLSPRIHQLIDATASGQYDARAIDSETMQAWSTYLHETVHWWQHMGSTAGFILSLGYPAQTHQNADRLKVFLRRAGAKKSVRAWSEQAARDGLTISDAALRAANIVVNNAVDLEFFKQAVFAPRTVVRVLEDPYFETLGHTYWMGYGHAVALIEATVDRENECLPDGAAWDDQFRQVRAAGIEGWVRGSQFTIAPIGLHALFEGQARFTQLQYLCFGSLAAPSFGKLKAAGYFDGIYGEAFEGFLIASETTCPETIDDPIIGLFLLIVDLAINPTAGFPLDIECFENFLIDVDPGVRFLRLCHAVRAHPELRTAIVQYSKEEYLAVSEVLVSATKYVLPAIGLQTIAGWAERCDGIAEILKERETFRFARSNIVVRVLLSHFVSFSIDKLARPEFFCWPGAWLAGPRLSAESQTLFLRYLSLYTDRADNDGIFPRQIPGKDPDAILKTLNDFYANIVMYDLTRQWTLVDGPFRYDLEWLSKDTAKEDLRAWCQRVFADTYGTAPDEFELL